ncbi:MAG TPA: DUF4350 domain-containing protein [Gammaproteobacteria bacterium]
MKDRLITAAGALVALLILYTMFVQRGEAPVTRPLSIETGRNGYAAISRWLEASGVRVVSLRERYDRLIALEPDEALDLPRRGNLLITTMPHRLPVRSREHGSLHAWIRSGNTLLILAALDDTPEWASVNASLEFLEDLQTISGVTFAQHQVERPRALTLQRRPIAPRSAVELDPVAGHPLMEGVERLRAYSDGESALWDSHVPGSEPLLLLRLARERSSGLDAAWERRLGNGHIILVASGSMLTNHVVAESDAGRFLANVVRHHVRGDGAVIFDDMHQGLSVIYDAAAFFGDPRLHRTLWFLIGAWLVYVLGSSNRFAPPAARPSGPRQRDFLEAVGGFMARRLDARDAGKMLFDAWFEELKRARGLRGDAPPWEALEATPTLDAGTYERLRRYHDALSGGKAVDLVRLHNMLRKAREAIG